MILQIDHFKDNVIFCRFLSWFLFFEYLIDLNAVISKAAELRNRLKPQGSRPHTRQPRRMDVRHWRGSRRVLPPVRPRRHR